MNSEVLKWFFIAVVRGEFRTARKILKKKRDLRNDNNVWFRCKYMEIEIHLVDHCNLNCASCFHYSPVCKPFEISIEGLRKQIQPFDGIADSLQLLGGDHYCTQESMNA